ncbi:MAG: hypothetical protein JWQ07_3935, partial [Ramlibacter sp.]|nr:hypothetical protein [Ramlibacter sp.]
MNNQIQNAYINALLADAAYVDADLLATDLPKRMTPTLAAYITANFEAVSSINTSDIPLLGSGFDATVWRGRADGDFAGQVFVSMRGTEVFPGADLLADGDLALASGARYQITDMINWWLRETTPVGQMAKQIKWDEFRRTDPNPLSNAVDPGFVFDTSVAGTEHLVGVTNVQVDGHSLGGHLATAFARIFGANNATTGSANVQAVSTYNSAGFNGSSTEALFQTIQTLLGTGINSFAPISAKQTNFFGQNGVEVTTNTWWFNQMGQRVGLYQEDDLAGGVNPFTNHFMYKQTDLLALGAALEKLDSTYTFAKLNTLVKAGSNVMAASYEGVLDGLRRIFQGNSIASTQPGDVSDSGPSRVDYQTNIDQLLKSVAFKSLIGKATVELADSTLASQAKTDFSAFLSLQTLSPIYLKTDTTGQAILKQANEGLAQQWEADQSLTPAQRVAGLSNFSDAYLLDRQAMLQALIAINKVDGSYDDPIRGVLLANYTYTDLTSGQVIKFKGTASDANVQESQQVIFGNNQDNSLIGSDSVAFGLGDRLYGGGGNDSIDAKSGDDYLEGNAGDDNLLGGDGNDVLLGCAGNDFLNGEAGNDQLQGGTGTDTYLFSGTWGKDTIVDSDGSGSLKIDGYTLSSGQTIVDADGSVVWAQKLPNGQIIHYRVLDSSSSNTSKQLVITKESDSANTITVNNFDQSQAFGDGYLGIQLSTSPKIAVVDRSSQTQTSSGSFWRDLQADIASLVGKVSTFAEGNGKFFTLFLNTPAGLGATAVLSLAGLAGRSIKAVLGDQTVDADGATISLAEGQTQVTFALIQDGPLDADALGSFKVTYESQGQSVESNAWGLDIKDAGESTSTVTGDFIKSSAGGSYLITNNNYVSAGAQPDSPDVLNGGDDRETLLGKGGNDGLYGGDGADSLDGGTGDDLLLGGTGADTLNGGDGNDIIFGSAVGGINTPTSTTFTLPDVPANSQAVARGFSWMATRALPAGGDTSVTFRPLAITGAIASPGWLDSAGQQFVEVEGNVIDGGAGDDYIAAGTNDDRVEGGDGNDVILGMDHSDLLMGDAGDDFILGDGTQGNDPTTFTPLERHGADFIDGGEGNDVMLGQGGDDVLYGGDGNDQAWGDGALDNNDQASKAVEFQGNDYLDGEDGDDSLTGGGKDDTLYGGTGNDKLWGDGGHAGEVLLAAQGNDYLDGEEGDDYLAGGGSNDQLFGGDGNDTMLGDDQQSVLPVSAHGDDYMDGEDGNDLMAGGGGNDTLYGGTGNDQMQGDDLGSNVAASAHGNDYLDGEAGDDTLIGGGKDDTLYGGEGADLLRGDDRGDAVAGTFHGADYLDGEAGNDTLIGDGGADTLYGGDGNDALSGDDSGNIVAGAFHGVDYLDGEAGNDTLRGGGGADTLYGGDGDDVVAGDDDLSLLAAEFHGDDVLDGGNGNDQLIGGGGNDQLAGGAGDDILVGDAGDTVTGVNGNDVLDGGDGADALLGNGGNDQLAGGAGNDTLLGGAGDDYLDGGTGVNYLFGGAGNDTLVGSAADYLEGGAGDDTYIVSGDGTSIPSIYDSRGHNTLTLDGSAQEYTP